MTYTELLNRTIENSGLKNIDIIEKLKDYNITITKSYLSILRNDPDKKGSDELSRAIAEICGAPKSLLVIQSQLDKASDELKSYIDISTNAMTSNVKAILDIIPNTPEIKQARDKFMNWSQADIICDIIEHPDDYETENKNLNNIIKNIPKPKYAIVPIAYGQNVKIVDNDEIKTVK